MGSIDQSAIMQIKDNFLEAISGVTKTDQEKAAAPLLAALCTDAVLEIYGVSRPPLDVAKLVDECRHN